MGDGTRTRSSRGLLSDMAAAPPVEQCFSLPDEPGHPVEATGGAASSGIRVAAKNSEPQALEGERKTVTALFADIKGSTEMMEDLDPEEARAVIDPALKLMIEAGQELVRDSGAFPSVSL